MISRTSSVGFVRPFIGQIYRNYGTSKYTVTICPEFAKSLVEEMEKNAQNAPKDPRKLDGISCLPYPRTEEHNRMIQAVWEDLKKHNPPKNKE